MCQDSETHLKPVQGECAKLRGLRGSRGLEKLRGSWVVGRGSWVTLRGYVSGTFCVGCPFCVSLIAA